MLNTQCTSPTTELSIQNINSTRLRNHTYNKILYYTGNQQINAVLNHLFISQT